MNGMPVDGAIENCLDALMFLNANLGDLYGRARRL